MEQRRWYTWERGQTFKGSCSARMHHGFSLLYLQYIRFGYVVKLDTSLLKAVRNGRRSRASCPSTCWRPRAQSTPIKRISGTGRCWHRGWEALTARGGEGMVVKPVEFVARGPRGLIQPAIKCRGREYLRLIYGPQYTAPENLERLRERGLSAKRSLALREFALGIEALERFVRGEPLRRVHECVFGVLALESEPVDPRL